MEKVTSKSTYQDDFQALSASASHDSGSLLMNRHYDSVRSLLHDDDDATGSRGRLDKSNQTEIQYECKCSQICFGCTMTPNYLPYSPPTFYPPCQPCYPPLGPFACQQMPQMPYMPICNPCSCRCAHADHAFRGCGHEYLTHARSDQQMLSTASYNNSMSKISNQKVLTSASNNNSKSNQQVLSKPSDNNSMSKPTSSTSTRDKNV